MKKLYVLLPVALAALVGFELRGDVACFVALAKFAGHILYIAGSIFGVEASHDAVTPFVCAGSR